MNHVEEMNSTTANSSDYSSFSTMSYSTRNLLLGIIGVPINLVTLLVLIRLKEIKMAVKITVVCLIVSNLLNLSAMIISGSLICLDSKNTAVCLPILYLILIPTTVMYFMLAHQSVYLYTAMFYPIQFRSWPKIKVNLFSSIFSWVYSLVISLVSIGFSLPSGLPCMSWVQIRGTKVIATGLTIVVSSLIVLFVNFRVFSKIYQRLQILRQRSRIYPNGDNMASFRYQSQEMTRSGRDLTIGNNGQQQYARKLSLELPISRQVGFLSKLLTISTISRGCDLNVNKITDTVECLQTPTRAAAGEDAGHVEMQMANPVALRCRDIFHMKTWLLSSDLHQRAYGLPICRSNTVPVGRGMQERWRASAMRCPHIPVCNARTRKNTKLLFMFTMVCCFLNLPYSIFFIWLAFIPEEQAFDVAQSMAGIVASTLNTLSCIVTPLMYVSGFLSWGKYCNKHQGSHGGT